LQNGAHALCKVVASDQNAVLRLHQCVFQRS
jgi:hypothetical protein